MQAPSVLVVEDDAGTRQHYAEVLRAARYTVACAANGREAMSYLLLAHAPPRLIVLDLGSGWDFRAEQLLVPEWAAIPVLLVSGQPDLARHAAELGAATFLSKPVAPEQLLTSVGNYCRPAPG